MIKISVIIPVYNSAPYLQKCMDSIINQTYENTLEGDKSFVISLQKKGKQVLSQDDVVNKLIEGKVYTWSIGRVFRYVA